MRVAIFGTTGAGKSTLLKDLKSLLDDSYIFIDENFESPYFKQAYDENSYDIQTINYKLDLWMLTDRMKTFKKYIDQKNIIYDRSLLDSMVFAETDHNYGRLNDVDYNVFKDYFLSCVVPNFYDKELKEFKYDLVIYLKVDEDTAIQRINKRHRNEEAKTNDKFWKSLCRNYETWYQFYKDVLPIMVIDSTNQDHLDYAKKIVDRINEFDNKINKKDC
ncbi:deoxynucleoside kinase [Mycoplasma yeatsii]|uniref:deoxynucleoside kinase n=1 Tax=Mycoplasma yeatsii TaxID=51365 RepID=UPI0005B24AB1|nr:deoxynucleoside kinase [Mycoplasma yeatsii]AJM71826.1 deoxynucleoside kinase [Mycoplasma yeatsii GM274B]